MTTTGATNARAIADHGQIDYTGAVPERGREIAPCAPLTRTLCPVIVFVQSVPRSRGLRVSTHRDRQRRAMLRGFARDRVGTRVERGKRTRCGATCVEPTRRGRRHGSAVRRDCSLLSDLGPYSKLPFRRVMLDRLRQGRRRLRVRFQANVALWGQGAMHRSPPSPARIGRDVTGGNGCRAGDGGRGSAIVGFAGRVE